MTLFPVVQIAKKISAITLSFWVAGAGCMLGCENLVAAPHLAGASHNAEKPAAIVATGEACASSSGHSCCKAKSESKPKASPATQKNKLAYSAQPSSGGMKACPLAVSRSAAVSRASSTEQSAPSSVVTYFLTPPEFLEQKIALSTPSLMPNRGHTYLRCCAFLI